MSILLVGPPPWEKKPLSGRIGSSTLEPVAGWVFTEDVHVLSNRAGTYRESGDREWRLLRMPRLRVRRGLAGGLSLAVSQAGGWLTFEAQMPNAACRRFYPYGSIGLRAGEGWFHSWSAQKVRRQNDRLPITRDEGSRRRRALGVYKRDSAPHDTLSEMRRPRAQTGLRRDA